MMREHDRNSLSEPLPEVDPLSDLSWRRIEDQLFARLDAQDAAPTTVYEIESTRRLDRRWAIAGVALAAAAAVLLLFSTRGGGPGGEPARTSRIAAAEASSQVTIGDVSMTVQPHSAVLVTERDSGTDIVLERGAVRCAVAPQREGMVRVFAGEVTVEVVGTIFAVSRSGDSAEVEVERGVVEVVFRGVRERVEAGEAWSDARADLADLEMKPDVIRRRRVRKRSKRSKRSDRARRTASRAEAAATPAAPTPTVKQRFTSAAALESKDPAAAIEAYRGLIADGGAWAAPALYAKGRLEAETGRTAAAHKSLTRYLARHPGGANAADARALLSGMK